MAPVIVDPARVVECADEAACNVWLSRHHGLRRVAAVVALLARGETIEANQAKRLPNRSRPSGDGP